jgi:NAD+ synthase (glutamine-hydrolysing)
VYGLTDWINAHPDACGVRSAPIPDATRTKPPSAELKPDQTDQDTLPDYETLDEIIHRYVTLRQRPSRITQEAGIDADTVRRCVRLIDVNEYKRQQAPIGLKVTDVAFGSGRRVPVAQRFDARSI